MSRWFLSPCPSEGASCPTVETRPHTLIIFWSTPVLGSFCIQHFLNFLLNCVLKKMERFGRPWSFEQEWTCIRTTPFQCWYRTRHSLKSRSIYLITVKKMTLPKVHQRKCTLEIINTLTFSAFPDLMWQQRSKKENLFHSPAPFAILMFLLSSPLCDHEALYLLSPTGTHREKTVWN